MTAPSLFPGLFHWMVRWLTTYAQCWGRHKYPGFRGGLPGERTSPGSWSAGSKEPLVSVLEFTPSSCCPRYAASQGLSVQFNEILWEPS